MRKSVYKERILKKSGSYVLFLVVFLTALDMLATDTDWRFILYGQFVLNAIIPALVFALLTVVTRNPGFSATIVGLFAVILYWGNHLLYLYWDRYLVPAQFDMVVTDMKITKLATEVVDLPLLLSAAVIVLPTVIVATVLAVLALRSASKKELRFPLRARVASFTALVAASAGLYYGTGPALAVMDLMAMKPRDWNMEEQLKYGLFNHLYIAAAQPAIFPRMVKGDPLAIVDHVESMPVLASSSRSPMPDVVVMLAESMIDPLTLRPEFRADPMARLRDGERRNRAGGLARVHTVGGRSWLTEYSLLTGIPPNLFSVEATRPFSLAGPRTRTIAHSVKANGYKTVAMYAAPADVLFDARKAYLALGFDEFLDVPDMRERFGEADGTDDGVLLNAARELQREKGQPVFLFLVTHDLHMPYPPVKNSLFVDEAVGTPQIQEYFRRLSIFSAKTAMFVDELQESPEPTLFAMFGDHIPPMPRDFEKIGFRGSIPDPLYATPYLISSNYRSLDSVPAKFDVSYAPGLILDLAKLNVGRYFRINSAVRTLCDGHFTHCPSDPQLLQSYHAYLSANIIAR